MAAEHGGLNFMFLAPPPPPKFLEPLLMAKLMFSPFLSCWHQDWGGGGEGKAQKRNFAQNVDRKSF